MGAGDESGPRHHLAAVDATERPRRSTAATRQSPGVGPEPTVVDRIRRYLDGDSGVSPVVGVLLMVAITVMLAAVMGAIFLGLGQQLGTPAPTTSVSISDAAFYYGSLSGPEDHQFTAPVFVLTHEGGDEVVMRDVRVTVRDPDTGAVILSFSVEDNSPWTAVPEENPDHHLVGDYPDGVRLEVNGETPTAGTEFGVGDTITIVDKDDSANLVNTDLERFEEYEVQMVHLPSESTMAEKTIMLY